jgi:hypothetical protein
MSTLSHLIQTQTHSFQFSFSYMMISPHSGLCSVVLRCLIHGISLLSLTPQMIHALTDGTLCFHTHGAMFSWFSLFTSVALLWFHVWVSCLDMVLMFPMQVVNMVDIGVI